MYISVCFVEEDHIMRHIAKLKIDFVEYNPIHSTSIYRNPGVIHNRHHRGCSPATIHADVLDSVKNLTVLSRFTPSDFSIVTYTAMCVYLCDAAAVFLFSIDNLLCVVR